MKKYLIILLFAIVGNVNMRAQHGLWDIVAGAKGGIDYGNFTSLKGDAVVSPHVAGTLGIYFSEQWGMSMEIGYKHYGTRNVFMSPEEISLKYPTMGSDDVMFNSGRYDYSVSYVDVNYFAKYYMTKGLNLYGGFKMGRVINAYTKHNGVKTSLRKKVKTAAFSFPVGVEYEINNLTFDLRYEYNLQKLASSNSTRKMLGGAHVHGVTFTVGYLIQLM